MPPPPPPAAPWPVGCRARTARHERSELLDRIPSALGTEKEKASPPWFQKRQLHEDSERSATDCGARTSAGLPAVMGADLPVVNMPWHMICTGCAPQLHATTLNRHPRYDLEQLVWSQFALLASSRSKSPKGFTAMAAVPPQAERIR
jgi:hypothetical protein